MNIIFLVFSTEHFTNSPVEKMRMFFCSQSQECQKDSERNRGNLQGFGTYLSFAFDLFMMHLVREREIHKRKPGVNRHHCIPSPPRQGHEL